MPSGVFGLRIMQSIVTLLPTWSQPRYWKRITGLNRYGISITPLYFSRAYFNGDARGVDGHCLGCVQHGRYLFRIMILVRSIPSVRKQLRINDGLYAFGLDMALLALFGNIGIGKPVFYEIGDIRQQQLAKNLKGKVTRLVERWVAHRTKKIVVTARGFADEYLVRWIGVPEERIRIIENRLDLPSAQRPQRTEQLDSPSAPLVIGYFGVLRCPWTLATLKAITQKSGGRIRIHIHGYALGVDVSKEAIRDEGLEYFGEYRSPDDLAGMYEAVDIVWATYPAPRATREEGNWMWARTNRFYEACYFRRPMIVLAGGDEGQEVAERGIGYLVHLRPPEEAAADIIQALTPDNIAHWHANVSLVPDEVCVYTDEHEKLGELLKCQ